MINILLAVPLLLLGMFTIDSTGGQLIMIGTALNGTVFVTNGFRMPAFDKNRKDMPEIDDGIHVYNPKNPNFAILGDWFNLPLPGGAIEFSIGDALIFTGLLFLIFDSKPTTK